MFLQRRPPPMIVMIFEHVFKMAGTLFTNKLINFGLINNAETGEKGGREKENK